MLTCWSGVNHGEIARQQHDRAPETACRSHARFFLPNTREADSSLVESMAEDESWSV